MGLLKTPEREENLVSPQGTEALKDPSPFKDLMATLEKPAGITEHPGKESTLILFFWVNSLKLLFVTLFTM